MLMFLMHVSCMWIGSYATCHLPTDLQPSIPVASSYLGALGAYLRTVVRITRWVILGERTHRSFA